VDDVEKKIKVGLFTPSLAGGGAERVILNLANGLAEKGLAVDLVSAQDGDTFRKDISEQVNAVHLGAGRMIAAIPALVRYLRQSRPAVLISAQTHANLTALWANRMAGNNTRLVVCEHFNLSLRESTSSNRREKVVPWLAERFYGWADRIVAVSEGVAEDLAQTTGIAREKIRTIYNPVVSMKLIDQSQAQPDHPWFGQGEPPVVLGIGRLTSQKDFGGLIRAFAILRRNFNVKLMILGEGEERANLEKLVLELGLQDVVDLHGFETNPYAYLKRAGVFVLSSVSEGLPTVLIEALACGAPVVSTDCPSGPREILEGGRFGKLVAVGDVQGLACAMEEVLKNPPDGEAARQRAMDFSLEKGIGEYYKMVMELVGNNDLKT
jgi:glycosyltransferase involved in cell wall biosynthesis